MRLQYDRLWEDLEVRYLRNWTVAMLLALVPLASWGADFRQSSWGDSPQAVLAAETAPLHHQKDGEIAFIDSSIEGIDGGVIYLFERRQLVRGVYVSRDDYSGGEGALEDRARLRAHFDDVLDIAGVEERRWLDDSLRDQPERLAEAVSKGMVRLTYRWTLERTHVDLVLTGKEGGVLMRAVFQPTR